jgi:sugar lactone lactonase YvrE
MRRILIAFFLLIASVLAYLLLWPVPVAPVAWVSPPNPGYSGVHAVNHRLRDLELFDLHGLHGPEAIAVDSQGGVHAATSEGYIVRLDVSARSVERWVQTGGRPLGLAFARNGNLIVADAVLGLLSISPDGAITTLATVADGVSIGFADDVDVAADGRIYFSDASTRFTVELHGDNASRYDIIEHGRHGRLLEYDPVRGRARTIASGLAFANGVAVSPDQQFVLVCETGAYRVTRVWIDGPRRGESEPFVESLPGFPDNITVGRDGRFWIALYAPRIRSLDAISGRPMLRRIMTRLPQALQPAPVHYTHVIAVDSTGEVVIDLQDPGGAYQQNTSALETEEHLWLGSLTAPAIARLPRERIPLP